MKAKMIVLISLLLISISSTAHAGLYQYSSQIVIDDRDTANLMDDLIFYRDLSRFSDMTYAEQLVSIDALNTEISGAGPWQDNWHLATSAEMQGVSIDDWVNVPNVFLPSDGVDLYAGRYESIGAPGTHMVFEVYPSGSPPWSKNSYGMPDTSSDPTKGAWAVANYQPMPVVLTVEIDIKPGSDPNPINPKSKGLVPVAIFSSTEFDATQVDPTSICLAGANVAVRGKGNKLMAHEEDVNGDGLVDLLVQVETQDFDDLGDGGTVELTGTTFDNQAIVGYDEVIIVPKKKNK